jgi:recombination protein RecT
MNELVKPVENKLIGFLGKYKGQIEGVLARQIDPKRFTRMIVAQINKTPKLLECTPMSVVNSALQAASLGLEIRTNQAYLVPFKDKWGKTQCNLLIDYRGKIDLAKRSGFIKDMEARLVYAADEFECSFGAEPRFIHRPFLMHRHSSGVWDRVSVEERGEVILGYAIAWIKGARAPHIEPMTYSEIEGIRSKSRSKNDGPWVTDWGQMARKTLIHRICNYIPQSPELAIAQDLDDRLDVDIPLEPVIDVAPEDDEQPLLATGKDVQTEVMAEKLREIGVDPTDAVAKRQSKEGPRQPKYPKFDDFPEMNQIQDGQMLYVKGVLYRFTEERSAYEQVQPPSATH